jgi:hypothetical protein
MVELKNKYLSEDEKAEVRVFLLGEPIIIVQSGIIKADETGDGY